MECPNCGNELDEDNYCFECQKFFDDDDYADGFEEEPDYDSMVNNGDQIWKGSWNVLQKGKRPDRA